MDSDGWQNFERHCRFIWLQRKGEHIFNQNKSSFLMYFLPLLCLWSWGQVKASYIVWDRNYCTNSITNKLNSQKLLISAKTAFSGRAQDTGWYLQPGRSPEKETAIATAEFQQCLGGLGYSKSFVRGQSFKWTAMMINCEIKYNFSKRATFCQLGIKAKTGNCIHLSTTICTYELS